MSIIGVLEHESEIQKRNEQATAELLARLIYHHGAEETAAVDDRQVEILEQPQPLSETSHLDAWVARQKQIHAPLKPRWFSVVGDLGPVKPCRPQIEEIQLAVAKHYGVKRLDILSERRAKNIVKPRQVAMYLAKELTTRSLPEIGRRFGGRDHTTALHAVNKIARLAEQDDELASDIEAIRAELRA